MSWRVSRPGCRGKAVPDPRELIEQRRAELVAKGYRPGMVALAIDWAVNSAEGMASYFGRDSDLELYEQFLPKYLKDAERWIRSFDGES